MRSTLLVAMACALLIAGCPQTPELASDAARVAAMANGLTPGIYSGTDKSVVKVITTGAYNPGDPTRLNVTDGLRAACNGYLSDDAAIQSFLSLAEEDRKRGYSRFDLTDGTLAVCTTLLCLQCNTAIINQIFSPSIDQPNTAQTNHEVTGTLVITEEGKVQSDGDTVQVGGLVLYATTLTENYARGVGTGTFNVRLDWVDTASGSVLFSAVGSGSTTVRQVDDRTISTQAQIAVGHQDILGSMTIQITTDGRFTR
ncbi:MAG: hypothetical protein HRU75_12395 [Planctomycetia bacterium]|nr:MAG: hypothetical protein HRU75_12395 [Planctomycetia bacterium]